QEAEKDKEANGNLRAAQFPQQESQPLGLVAEPNKLSRRLHREDDAGEAPVELVHVDPPSSESGIIDVSERALDTLENHKVIEIPVDDAWHWGLSQGRRLLSISLRGKSETLGCLDDIARLAAVPRHATFDPQLLEGHPYPVICQHHGKACR